MIPPLFSTALAAILFALAQPVAAQTGTEPVDTLAISFIKSEVMERGQVLDHATWMTDVHGARLTGSGALDRAQQWAHDRFESWGIDTEVEPWGTFGRGWTADRMAMAAHVTGPDVAAQSFPLTAVPEAWSPSVTAARGELVVIGIGEDMDPASLDLDGKIVLLADLSEIDRGLEPIATRYHEHELLELANAGLNPMGSSRRYSPELIARYRALRAQTTALLQAEPLAILTPSGTGGSGAVRAQQATTMPRNAGAMWWRSDPWTVGTETVPQFALLDEHANRLLRLVESGQDVTVEIDFAATFTDEAVVEENVIAEIPGTDFADEIVMIGAHLDSWHSGSGATDNAAGSAVVMEAARVLKAYYDWRGSGPRRTIRFALWSGEEQGLLGARAYVDRHFAMRATDDTPLIRRPGYENISAYYNMDNGSGRFRGVYMQGNEAVRPIFRAWLDAFGDPDAQTLTLEGTSSTDHAAFDDVGIPGFQFIQDPLAYTAKTWHTHLDLYDHLDPDDLKQATAIMATFAHHTAERDDLLPRKPVQALGPAVGVSSGQAAGSAN